MQDGSWLSRRSALTCDTSQNVAEAGILKRRFGRNTCLISQRRPARCLPVP